MVQKKKKIVNVGFERPLALNFRQSILNRQVHIQIRTQIVSYFENIIALQNFMIKAKEMLCLAYFKFHSALD